MVDKLPHDKSKAVDSKMYADFVLTQLCRPDAEHNPEIRRLLETAAEALETAFRMGNKLTEKELSDLD